MVFDGKRPPFREIDEPEPIVPYGRAKRDAETAVIEAGGLVVRTSLVYSLAPLDPKSGILIRGLESGGFDYVYFADEIRCPIHLEDLCGALFELGKGAAGDSGILHVVGLEAMIRYDLACRLAVAMGYDADRVPRGLLTESGLVRPKDLVLNASRVGRIIRTRLRGVEEVLSAIEPRTRIQDSLGTVFRTFDRRNGVKA